MSSGLFRNVLEIGCADGYSTHSFVSALRDGGSFQLSICDVHFQKTVLDMVQNTPVKVFNKPSVEVISPEFDFIFVDGNHDINTVGQEISMLLDCGTDTILAHDTFIYHPDFRGAVLLRKVFSSHRDYLSFYYNEKKEGDQTHYGMSLFTKRKSVHDLMLDKLKN